MKNLRVVLLVPLILLCFFCLKAIAAPVIKWSPTENITIEQMQGTQSIHSMIINSTDDIEGVIVRIVPELQPWVTISPSAIENLSKDSGYELTLTINVPPDAAMGTYDGVVQIRQAIVGENQKTISKPLPIILTITEKDEDDGLPPDPGDAGKLTLLGVDSDSDGVRDDIQRYIYFTFQNNEKVQVALTQAAIEYQGLLAQAGDRDVAFNHATKMARHGECLDFIVGEEAADILAALKAEILNTKERSLAYIQYNNNLAGEIILGAPFQDWKNSCSFDVDAIGGVQ